MQLATATMLDGNRAESVKAARQAIDAAIAGGSATLESHARNVLGSSLVSLGREDEGLAELVAAGQLAEGNSRTLLRYAINYSDALALSGRYRSAVSEALTGIDVARSMGLERSFGAMLAGNAAEPLLALGEWDRAGQMIERALELDPPAHHYVHLRLVLGWMALWRGDLEHAEAMLNEFRHLISADQPAPQYSHFALRIDAEYAVAVGDHERAWADSQLFFDQVDLYPASAIYPLLASAATAGRVLDSADRADHRVGVVRSVLRRRRANRSPAGLGAGDRSGSRGHCRWMAPGVEGGGRRRSAGSPGAVRRSATGSASGGVSGAPRSARG